MNRAGNYRLMRNTSNMGRGRRLRETLKGVNVATVPHRSPFRYPGGKTWFVPHVRTWLSSLTNRPKTLCEPFCGGAIVGLSMLFEQRVDKLFLVELDEDVASVWQSILNGHASDLAEKIIGFHVTIPAVRAVLDVLPRNLLDRAFSTIIKNRMNRGGILAPGASLLKRGENGRGLLSRWYPGTLQNRILAIATMNSRIRFHQGDGIRSMARLAASKDTVFFIDPPYTVAGKRLYTHSEIDHEMLFDIAARLRGDFLMTYDEAEPIKELARKHNFETHTVLMKNTHHRVMRELLVGKNLEWARSNRSEPRLNLLLEAR